MYNESRTMKDVYSVSAVNQYIKELIGSDYQLSRIFIKGEISNCKYHSTGHIYFTLKDAGAAIACVMFASARAKGLTFQMRDGMQVIALGSIRVFERDGKYQLYAVNIIQDGAGLLYERFEALKRKLSSEGLFDQIYKKQLPMFPKKVGIVTAREGAALRDMINISSRRNPYVQLILYPAKVQGTGAAQTVVSGICALEKYGVDVIIIGRGGGSIEDLWAFNEEIVARAIFACTVPVVSAVGHETDVTISDYAADLRAPTPSAAAELVIPDIFSVLDRIEENQIRLNQAIKRKIDFQYQKVNALTNSLKHLSPKHLLFQKRQYLDQLTERLDMLMQKNIEQKIHRLNVDIEKLKGASPLNKLGGGYAFVSDEAGNGIKSCKQLTAGDHLQIDFKDGKVMAVVQETLCNEP